MQNFLKPNSIMPGNIIDKVRANAHDLQRQRMFGVVDDSVIRIAEDEKQVEWLISGGLCQFPRRQYR